MSFLASLRRGFVSFLLFLVPASSALMAAAAPVDIGNRLELFADDFVIGETKGDVRRQLIEPEPREVVFTADASWEGNTSGYYTVFTDGEIFRMIYRGWAHDPGKKAAHGEITCYAESRDGIHWTKPNLGLFEWQGSKDNNIVRLKGGTHNFTAFRDDNPAAPANARYKAIGGTGRQGVQAFRSPDAKKWELIQEARVLTNGAFDSQNLAFWDADRREYRAYWRYFDSKKVRAIRTATSRDFITWENEADLAYNDGLPSEHLYTNAVQKYFRAPHLFIGFPTRFEPKSEQVEPIFMLSRDGVNFRRYAAPVIPRSAPANRDTNRGNYMVWGMLQLPGKPNEISVYGTENYYASTPGRVRRFVYRVDGFVALRGGAGGGEATTKTLKHGGRKLRLNYVVRPGGALTVEALDAAGKVVGKSRPLTGDAVDAVVAWSQDPRLAPGLTRLRFALRDADVYSLRFD